MILCLDVGNSHIFAGVFLDNQIKLRFRYDTKQTSTSDQIGIFLKSALRENNIDINEIENIAICSVVPRFDYSLRSACIKYFDCEPFLLQAGVKTGLKIKYHNPLEVGADRIANAIAAMDEYPNKNSIIIDFGTATTFCAISADKEYLGGVISAGMSISMDALQSNTAKLSSVEILKPERALGRTTTACVQSGLYFGHLGIIREVSKQIKCESFPNQEVVVIGTGGFSHLFEKENVFTSIMPDLVLQGLNRALQMNVRIAS